jgi:hypothetical protein
VKARALLAAATSALAPVAAAAGGTLLLAGCTSCQSTVRAVAIPAIAGASFDGAEIDQASHRVYLANRDDQSVAVVDLSGGAPRPAATVKLGAAPNGLAVAPDRQTLYAGLESGGLAVVDTRTMQMEGTIPYDGSVDLVDYSATTGKLYAGAGAEVLIVDPVTRQVTRRMTTSGSVEQPRFDAADGMVYVTVPGTDSLLQLDPKTGYITRTFVVPKCHPRGLGINPTRQLALLGCGGSIAMVNLRSGAQEVTRVVQGADVVTYDPGADRFVVASPHGPTDSAIGVFSGDGRFIGSVSSTPSAHAAVYDDAHGVVYAPGPAGLMSFAPVQCEPPPDWMKFAGGLSLFAIPFAGFALFLTLYARRRRRRGGPGGPTMQELREEDLAMERERMRALEDGILGPEG